jgi:hypothetical protein
MAHLKSPGGIKQFGLQPLLRRLHENAALRVGKNPPVPRFGGRAAGGKRY